MTQQLLGAFLKLTRCSNSNRVRNQKYNNTGPQTSRECFKIEELRYRSDYISIVCDRWRPEQVWFLQWTWYYTYVECVALFSLCPDVYARLFKISGVSGRKKIRVERISPYFLGKKIESQWIRTDGGQIFENGHPFRCTTIFGMRSNIFLKSPNTWETHCQSSMEVNI